VILAGRALVDGAEVGTFAALRAGARDEVVRQSFECRLPQGARVLRLEPRMADGIAGALRVGRVTLMRPAAAEALRRTRLERPPADLARLFETLRVMPGAPVARERLPRVAIVIPNLDGRGVLEDCLASVAELDYPRERVDVVLVDNGSTDGSVALVRERFPDVRIVQHERNLGFAAACNAGARAARDAEVVVFLNNDMRFERAFLAELVAPLVRRECAATTAKILGWDGRTIDTSGTGTTMLGIAVQPGYGEPPRPEHDVPRKTLFACGGAMAIDAAVLRDAGGFDEEYFAYYEDLDLGWRLWVLGHEIHYVPSALCHHHHSHTSKRFPPEVVRLVMIRNSLYTCVKNYDDANLARILPVMLALAVRRAHLKSGLDERPLRIEQARVNAGDPAAGGTMPIERIGAADLVAIDDLLANWEHWMERRRAVQSRRRRGDDEIQRMFLQPLACVEADPAYARLQQGLVELYRLGDLFARS
jgi:GT2 family glycosyltransferase